MPPGLSSGSVVAEAFYFKSQSGLYTLCCMFVVCMVEFEGSVCCLTTGSSGNEVASGWYFQNMQSENIQPAGMLFFCLNSIFTIVHSSLLTSEVKNMCQHHYA